MEVTWKSVTLPLEELTGYRVYYSQVESRKRQTGETVTFPRDVSSRVIGGLETGESYQFQVTALARTVDGTEVEGEASVVDDSAIATPGEQGKLRALQKLNNVNAYVHVHVCCSGSALRLCVSL